MDFIRDYFKNQHVTAEIPAFVSETTKGKITHRFNGKRLGYDFKNGVAVIDRKDIQKFREYYPHIIIHDGKE